MPTKNLHALLVGINDYAPQSDVPSLRACVNDVEAIANFLSQSYQATYNIQLQRFLNKKATYQSITNYLQKDLIKQLKSSNTENIFLFYFSGHGSIERAGDNTVFEEQFGSHTETLVCYDSRTKQKNGKYSGFDLTDKEIAYHLQQIDQHCEHIVVILDCCHAGSGTKSTTLLEEQTKQLPARTITPTENRPYFAHYSSNKTPISQHILLAACRNNETARELADGSNGLFTSCLLQVLNYNRHISYYELLVRTETVVRGTERKQNPQLESHGGFDSCSIFLNPLSNNDNQYLQRAKLNFRYLKPVQYGRKTGWEIAVGILNGVMAVPNDTNQLPSKFALYDKDLQLVTEVMAQQIYPNRSRLKAVPELKKYRNQQLYGLLINGDKSLSTPVKVVDKGADLNWLKGKITNTDTTFFHFLEEESLNKTTDIFCPIVLEVSSGNLNIYYSPMHPLILTDENSLGEKHNSLNDWSLAMQQLEHLAQWHQRCYLQSDLSATLKKQVKVQLEEIASSSTDSIPMNHTLSADDNQERDDDQLELIADLDYTYGWRQFTVKVRNDTEYPIYCLLYFIHAFDKQYMIYYIGEAAHQIMSGQTEAIVVEKTGSIEHDIGWFKTTQTEITDHYRLLVSEQKFPLEIFQLGNIPKHSISTKSGQSVKEKSTDQPLNFFPENFWFFKDFSIRLIKK